MSYTGARWRADAKLSRAAAASLRYGKGGDGRAGWCRAPPPSLVGAPVFPADGASCVARASAEPRSPVTVAMHVLDETKLQRSADDDSDAKSGQSATFLVTPLLYHHVSVPGSLARIG